MDRKILSVLPLSLLAVACQHGEISIRGCPSLPIAVKCEDNRVDGNAVVNLEPQGSRKSKRSILAQPSNICIDDIDKEDKLLELRLPAGTPVGTVWSLPRNIAQPWLLGSNFPDSDKILITIPEGTPKGHYDYSLFSASGACTDPRVHIR